MKNINQNINKICMGMVSFLAFFGMSFGAAPEPTRVRGELWPDADMRVIILDTARRLQENNTSENAAQTLQKQRFNGRTINAVKLKVSLARQVLKDNPNCPEIVRLSNIPPTDPSYDQAQSDLDDLVLGIRKLMLATQAEASRRWRENTLNECVSSSEAIRHKAPWKELEDMRVIGCAYFNRKPFPVKGEQTVRWEQAVRWKQAVEKFGTITQGRLNSAADKRFTELNAASIDLTGKGLLRCLSERIKNQNNKKLQEAEKQHEIYSLACELQERLCVPADMSRLIRCAKI
jgi:hypothetical protein